MKYIIVAAHGKRRWVVKSGDDLADGQQVFNSWRRELQRDPLPQYLVGRRISFYILHETVKAPTKAERAKRK